jgi:hypothetical protein
MIDLNKNVVYTAGAINLEDTLKNCAASIVAYNESKSNDLDAVAGAVSQVFDTYKGAHIATPALTTLVLGILKPTSLEAMATLQVRVREYVVANSGEGGTLKTAKGKGGGISRRCDAPVAEAK